MYKNKHLFKKLEKFNGIIIMANKKKDKIKRIKDIKISIKDTTERPINLDLKNVLFKPNLGKNLLLIKSIIANSYKAEFYKKRKNLKLTGLR
jgi:hypothetical protein